MKIKLTNARIAFPALFKEDKFEHFSARFIFETGGATAKAVDAAIDAAGSEKFGAKWVQTKKILSTNNKLSVHSGDILEDTRPEYKGMSYINSKSKVRPVVKDRSANDLFDEGAVYGGCRVDAILDIFAGNHPTGGNYISVKLLGVQFRADDDAFSAGSRAEDADFSTIAEGADADDL